VNELLDITYDLISELARVAAQSGTTPERLRRLADLFADPQTTLASRPNGDALVEEMRRLMEPLQYLVLNAPSTIGHNEERIFIATLNPFISLPPMPQMIERLPQNDRNCEVRFFSRKNAAGAGASETKKMELKKRWSWEWNRYAALTYHLQCQGVFTWNQFLLHGCRFPATLGLAWRGEAPKTYFSLSAALARGLHLPGNTEAIGWAKEIVNLPNFLDFPGGNNCSTYLSDRLLEMQPIAQNPQVAKSAAFAIYHLMQSYAIWGGDGFLSIPVLIGASSKLSVTAVLSLCAKPNLELSDIFIWHAIAAACLAPVSTTELVEFTQLEERNRALEGAGHTLKWTTEQTGWEPVAEGIRQVLNEQREADYPRQLRIAQSSLKLVCLSQGLGNLIRVVTTVGKDRIKKLVPWYDPSEVEVWETGDWESVCAAYSDLVFKLGIVICHGTGWPKLQVECPKPNGKVEIRKWRHGDASSDFAAFSPSTMRVPPFKRGSDAIHVLIAALGEPMKNATKAMLGEGVNPEEPLRVRLSGTLPEVLVIEIGNWTRRRFHGLPDGVQDTQVLIQAAEIAEYGQPYLDPENECLAWLPLRLNPIPLIRKIEEEIQLIKDKKEKYNYE